MKTLITLIAASVFSFSAAAHGLKEHPEKYCAKMQDGKKTVMHQGKAITAEVTLENGTKIKPDGTITKKDGTTLMLEEGECISKDGIVAMETEKTEPLKDVPEKQ